MLNWLPENISTFGGKIDGIMYTIYYVVGVWFLVAEGLLFYFIFSSRKKPGVPAAHATGRSLKALSWVLIPSILVLVCDFAIDAQGSDAWETVKQSVPAHPDALVRIEAQQFAWNFRHAGKDGKLDTVDDVVTNGQLHCPVGGTVRFELVSKDVLHSFWVPNLRLKQDAVPGRTIPGWFTATKTGSYGIGCAELCGPGHGIMSANLIVQTPEEYEKFLQK